MQKIFKKVLKEGEILKIECTVEELKELLKIDVSVAETTDTINIDIMTNNLSKILEERLNQFSLGIIS